ncbi:hypothetical protein Tco_0653840 [Tanacetum coccineum]|uniref:EF-hand domain-containing protein n=1 Tax=Tanacetum coccineum TaxID=301880 RepID=A0ABQ4X2H5_9ASTR
MKRKLGRKESVSKQGRKNAKPEPEPTLDAFDDLDADGRDYMETEDVVKEGRQSNETEEFNKGSGEKGGNTEGPVSTDVPKTVSTARLDVEDSVVEPRTPPTTTSIFDDEDITMAQTLIKMKEEKATKKGVYKYTCKQRLKGKTEEEEASKAAIAETCDEVQAGIDADALFASKLQQEEREEYIIEEREKEFDDAYREEYGWYKHSQLKSNTFAEIQGLYERQKRVIDDFKPIDSDDAVKDSKEAAGIHKQKVLEEPNSTKKTDANLEEEEQLKAFLKIVPDEEGIIDYEVLEKWFSIINWESNFYDFDKHGAKCIYYRIFRFNGSSRWIKTFSELVTRFDRLDLVELYNLVMKSFETTTLEGVDLVLWEDLRTMFDANAEVNLQNQKVES